MVRWITAKKFAVQLILIFTLFTMGTVIMLGIPVTYLLGRQTEIQLRALLDQTNQTTIALFDNKINQLERVGSLITERPALRQLVFNGEDIELLIGYLEDFLANSGIDVIVLCVPSEVIAWAGVDDGVELCAPDVIHAFHTADSEVWILSRGELVNDNTREFHVVVGKLAISILGEFQTQSGMNYFLFDNGLSSVTTMPDIDDRALTGQFHELKHYQELILKENSAGDHTYMVARIPLPDQGSFELIGLMDIEALRVVNQQVRTVILATFLTVGVIGAFVAVLISRRISHPLNHLASSAMALRKGDLSTRLTKESDIWEIVQLTNALEDARVSLKHSLDQLRTEKAWIENLLDSIVEGIITIDEKNRVTYASEAIERILGKELAYILGHPVDDLFKPSSGENLFSHQIPDANQSRQIPVRIMDREVVLVVSASEFIPPDAGNADIALVVRDVTDEERVHRLIGAFLANITHEFRTPLSALAASVELLMEQVPSLSPDETMELLNVLKIGIIDLQTLINNLIEAASIEAGRFKMIPRPVLLSAILVEAVNTIQPIASKYGVSICLPKPKPAYLVNADQRRTIQAMLNLLSNAIKQSPANGKIFINTMLLKEHVVVEVQDQGGGVPNELHNKLFNRFTTHDLGKEFPQLGLGIGLSVVKAIIETQHGKVGFKNKEDKGAIFWFSLPLAKGD